MFVILRTIMEEIVVFTEEQIQAARFAKAMGHPVRMYVLELLNKQSCCYSGDLSDILPIAKSTLSQHLKELKEAGLIQGEIEAPKVKYCINRKNWEKAQQLFGKLFKK
ncbi:MAG: metalloregulator ArsR/SmtB family transcription factor [Prolixibacteraceae bacterium]